MKKEKANSSLETAEDSLGAWDVLIVVFIVLAALRLSHNVETTVGLMSDDEASYMWGGRMFDPSNLSPQWGPVYAAWYWFLSWFQDDGVKLYYLNWVLTTALPPTALYLAARAIGVVPFIAWLVAFYTLLLGLLLVVWPRINNFAAVLMLVGIAVAARCRAPALQWAVFAAAALLAAYVRPEFTVAFFLIVALAAGCAFIGKAPLVRSAVFVWVGVSAVGCCMLLAIGFPLKGGRSDWAFRQHFASNWKTWTGSQKSPWFQEDELFAEAFGEERSLAGALKKSPRLVVRHGLENLKNVARNAWWQLAYHEPVIWRNQKGVVWERLALTFLFLGFMVFTVRKAWGRVKENLTRHWVCWLALAALLLPALLSAVVIGWRGHYVLPLYFGCFLLVAVALPAWTPRRPLVMAGVGLLGLLIVPVVAGPSDGPKGIGPAVRALAAEMKKGPVRLLEFGHAGYFLDAALIRYDGRETPLTLGQLLEEKHLNAVLVEDPVRIPPGFAAAVDWRRFASAPAEFGFRAVTVGSSTLYLKAKSENLKE